MRAADLRPSRAPSRAPQYVVRPVPGAFAADARVTGADGGRHRIAAASQPVSFQSSSGDATLTLINRDTITGTVVKGNATWAIHSRHAHGSGSGGSGPHGHVLAVTPLGRGPLGRGVFGGRTAWCGTAAARDDRSDANNRSQENARRAEAPARDRGRVPARRAVDPGLSAWSDCFPGADRKWHVDIGIAVGHKPQQHFNSEDEVLAFVAAVVSTANYYIYERQLHLVLRVREIYLADRRRAPAWDDRFCAKGIERSLMHFKAWDPPAGAGEVALWHLLDDCWACTGGACCDPETSPTRSCEGVAGLSSIGGACRAGLAVFGAPFPAPHNPAGPNHGYKNRAVTYLAHGDRPPGIPQAQGAGTWLTFAHETGHLFGAWHPFDGSAKNMGVGVGGRPGRYGGVMDYAADTRINGEHQFNPWTNKDNVCGHVADACLHHITPVHPGCGNYRVEHGEACECKDGSRACRFCTNCTLEGDHTCTPDQVPDYSATSGRDADTGDGECCTDQGHRCAATTAPPACTDVASTGYTFTGTAVPITCADFASGQFAITCSNSDWVRRHCPVSCHACFDACVDSATTGFTASGGEPVSCAGFVGGTPFGKTCSNSDELRRVCPVTCGACHDVPAVLATRAPLARPPVAVVVIDGVGTSSSTESCRKFAADNKQGFRLTSCKARACAPRGCVSGLLLCLHATCVASACSLAVGV